LIRVVKHTTGGDRTFNFVVDPGNNALSATTSGGTGTSASLQVTKGTGYSVTETVPTDWMLSNASCALQGGGATGTFDSATHKVTSVEVEVGRLTECTFTNARDQGYLQIVKSATAGHNGTQFTFDVVCGPAGAPVFTANNVPVTINNNGNGTSTVLGPIETGNTCDVSEDSLPNWTVTASPQTSGSITSTDTQANPEQVTFVNTRDTGYLQIVKDATAGHNGTTFSFDVTCGPAGAPVFTANNVTVTIDANGDGTSSVLGPIETANTCDVTEQALAGWTATAVTVTSGNISSTDTQANPEQVTFTNSRDTGYLQIVKDATAGHNGTTFSFDVTCGPAGAPVFTQNNVTVTIDGNGDGTSNALGPIQTNNTCDVTEAAQAGWSAVATTVTSASITSAHTLVAPLQVTFTNSRDQGYVQIVKTATAGHAGTVFTYDVVCGPAGAPVFTQNGVTVTIDANGDGQTGALGPIDTGNTCQVSEAAVPGWTATSPVITSAAVAKTDTQAAPLQVTFNNTRDTGFLEITKTATAGHAGSTFTFDVVCGPAGAPVFTANNVPVTVDAAGNGTSGPVGPIETGNSCTVTEDSAAGWSSSPGSTTVGPIVAGNTRAAPAPTTFHNTFDIVSLSLAKKAQDASYAAVGEVLHYTYTLTNTGNVTLVAPFAVGDDLIASVSCSLAPASLAPGQSFDCTGSYTVTQADLDAGIVVNHATATATYHGSPVTSNPSSAQVPADQQPALGLVKSAAEGSFSDPGDVLNYTYTLTNIGNVTLEAPYAVTDDRAATVDCPATPATLAPGESVDCTATYEVTQADVNDGSVTNHATATAMFGGNTVLSNEDEVTVPAIQDPLVTAHKSVNKKEAEYGETLTYTVSATNSGNIDLTGVVVSDEIPDGTTYVDGSAEPAAIASFDAGDNTVSWAVGDLAVGATVDGLTFKVTVDQPEFDSAEGVPATTIDNVASVRSDVSDPVPSNHVKTPVIAVLGIHEERPPPALPFTGSTLPIPFAVSVAMLLLVGGALLTTPRRRRRA
jgi:uncharacterized repeat protein (TIGR01451 family)